MPAATTDRPVHASGAPPGADLASALKRAASDLGFELAGVCPAVTPEGIHRFKAWLEAGYAGEMKYLVDRAAAYEHPRHVLDGARSIVMLAMPYHGVPPQPTRPGEGRVSRYAWGTDYHDVVRAKLDRLGATLREYHPQARVRGVVDTAPLLEREFAELAGLGWVGKNTLLLNKRLGSWFFLAALLTDVELEYDLAHDGQHCGTCRACLDACPTGALVDAWVLDARKCISYLTIELRGMPKRELRPQMGDWLFGCDICQEVCPWNHHATSPGNAAHLDCDEFRRSQSEPLELAPLFVLSDEEFRARFRHTPMWRAKRRGLLRNAAIVLGNQAASLCGTDRRDALAALLRGLEDREPLVRAACAWALGQFDNPSAHAALESRARCETDPLVVEEIRQLHTWPAL